MAQVSLRKIVKAYEGGVQAVKGIDLDIADHEFVVLVGPSGCGKSTTLRMIAGLEEITSGEIAIGGTVVNDIPPRDRDIAMVFQNYALYPHMSVYDNMAFGLMLRKFPKAEIDRRVKEAARILDITPLLERKPKALSGGQRQRISIARALSSNPEFLVCDEPTSALDVSVQAQILNLMKELQSRMGLTYLFISHNLAVVRQVSDRIGVMYLGRIAELAP
ncbi:MAG: ATP-binding cassette domain-containing protein, partial [Roseomonas sp.]|nr:ATP-binding cassette domain-containing protein [Roseomonas sp.]